MARHPKAVGAGAIAAFFTILILAGAYFTPPKPDHGRRITSFSNPSGLVIGASGRGVGGATVQVRQVDQDRQKATDTTIAYVFVEVCAGTHSMQVGPEYVKVESFEGGRHDAHETDRAPHLDSGYVKAHHCRRGWVMSPIGSDISGFGAQTVEWQGDGWDTTRWAV